MLKEILDLMLDTLEDFWIIGNDFMEDLWEIIKRNLK